MEKPVHIRIATLQDAPALLNIYAPYVTDTAITFEYEVPTVQTFTERMQQILHKYPYFVAEADGQPIGYAYASSFHTRAAYAWAAEATIYVDPNMRHKGFGRMLYITLENALKLQNILNINACIAYPDIADEYLTGNSVAFHLHLGYRLVGKFHHCGYKFQRWYNMVWMEKHIGPHIENPPPFRRFDEVKCTFSNIHGII